MAALSVGDVLELAKLIHSAYEKCAGAGETLHEVGKNLQYLHRSVIFLGDVIKDPGRFGPKGQDMVAQLEQEIKDVDCNVKRIRNLLKKWTAILRMPYGVQSLYNKVIFIYRSMPDVENLHLKLKNSHERIQGTLNLLHFSVQAGKKLDEEAIGKRIEAHINSRTKHAKESRKREQECQKSRQSRKEQAHTLAKAATSKKMGAWQEVQEDLVKKGMSLADAKKTVDDIRIKLSAVESARNDPPHTPPSNRRESTKATSSSDPPKPAALATHHSQSAPAKQPGNLAPPNLRVTRANSDVSNDKAGDNVPRVKRRSRSASRKEELKPDAPSMIDSPKPDSSKESGMLAPASTNLRRAKSDSSVRKGEKAPPARARPPSPVDKEMSKPKPSNKVETPPAFKPALDSQDRKETAGGILCVDGTNGGKLLGLINISRHADESIVRSMITQTYLELVRVWTVNTTGVWVFDRVASAGAWLQSNHPKGGSEKVDIPLEITGNGLNKTAITAVAKTFYNSREKDEIVARLQQQKRHALGRQDFLSYKYILCLDTDVLASVEAMKARFEGTDLSGSGSLRARPILITGLKWHSHKQHGNTHPHQLGRMVAASKLALERFLEEELGWRRPTAGIWNGPYRTKQLLVAKETLDAAGIGGGEGGYIEAVRKKEGCEVRITDAESAMERLVSITGPKAVLEKAGLWPQRNEAKD